MQKTAVRAGADGERLHCRCRGPGLFRHHHRSNVDTTITSDANAAAIEAGINAAISVDDSGRDLDSTPVWKIDACRWSCNRHRPGVGCILLF